jgi:hypothetical protein
MQREAKLARGIVGSFSTTYRECLLLYSQCYYSPWHANDAVERRRKKKKYLYGFVSSIDPEES